MGSLATAAATFLSSPRQMLVGAEWRDAQSWPPEGTDLQRWFLHSRGKANTAGGDGVLSRDEPSAAESPDRIVYDPMDPCPSWGFRVMYTGGTTVAGPFDQARVERRDDVLVYTAPPFTEATSS